MHWWYRAISVHLLVYQPMRRGMAKGYHIHSLVDRMHRPRLFLLEVLPRSYLMAAVFQTPLHKYSIYSIRAQKDSMQRPAFSAQLQVLIRRSRTQS